MSEPNGFEEKSRDIARGLDWSGDFYRGPPNQTLTCAHCNEIYRDHARSAYLKEEGRFFLVSRNGCPNCHGHAIKSARSDIVNWSIGKGGGNT